MATISIKQELLREVYHDHTHFERMLGDLKEIFRAVVTKDESLQEHPDLVKTAREDASFLVEEMMDHIAVEEEAVFSIISDNYPQFNDKIHRFQDSHERICSKLNEIKHTLADKDPSDMEKAALNVYETLTQTYDMVEAHGREENSLFEEALSVLSEGDCQRLLEALREE